MERHRFKLIWVALVLVGLANIASAAESYFPPASFSTNVKLNDFVEGWYAEQLHALDEKPLWPAIKDGEHYRLTWLRTFHQPMSFRVDVMTDGSATLTAKQCDGAGGYEPGRLIRNSEIKLSKDFVDKLKLDLDGIEFWTMAPRLDEAGMDGARWIFEGSRLGTYHLVDRWSPDSTAFKNVMLNLMQASGLELDEIY
jgi:hypothetical protein